MNHRTLTMTNLLNLTHTTGARVCHRRGGPTPQRYHGSSLIHRCLLGIPSGNPDATCYVGDHRARGEGGFLRDREIYPDASRDADLAFAECRKPTSCDRLPVHRSESPTGYSSAGCSPAEPASASPVTVNSSSIAIRRGNQIAAQPHCRDAVQVALRRVRRQRECHLYFARRVSFLSCADIDP